ncbi:hypothetical protein RB628_31155 [Streptomyces sp. ADMS]|nr:hypothetical protein [Streptomyces sp. ADMS]MDW4909680.1 hypothetical protein [Streptomyces sp. ADMS]
MSAVPRTALSALLLACVPAALGLRDGTPGAVVASPSGLPERDANFS